MPFPSWIFESDDWMKDVMFLLDDELRLVDCNPAWERFAEENGGHGLSCREVCGRLILDFVPDVLRTFYLHKYWLAKRTVAGTHLAYDCSSPDRIRLLRMTMLPLDDLLLVTNHLRLEEKCEPRPPLTVEEAGHYIAPTGFVVMCANCRKTRRRQSETDWEWIPEMLSHDHSKVSHSLCTRCKTHLYG
jgi:hypothetical protein